MFSKFLGKLALAVKAVKAALVIAVNVIVLVEQVLDKLSEFKAA